MIPLCPVPADGAAWHATLLLELQKQDSISEVQGGKGGWPPLEQSSSQHTLPHFLL